MCDHDRRDVVEDHSGVICTRCGVVLDAIPMDATVTHEPPVSNRPAVASRLWSLGEDVDEGVVPAHKRRESTRAIASICNALRLNESIRDTARDIHVTVMSQKHPSGGFRGRQFMLSAVSCVYFACMVHNVSRAEIEFASNVEGITRSRLTAMNKVIRRMLPHTPYGGHVRTPLDPSHLVPRYLAALSVDPVIVDPTVCPRLRGTMERLLSDPGVRRRLEGRTPECVCVAASVVAMETMGYPCDRKVVSARCGVSLASINLIFPIFYVGATVR